MQISAEKISGKSTRNRLKTENSAFFTRQNDVFWRSFYFPSKEGANRPGPVDKSGHYSPGRP